jgi:hypothetical protein
VIVLAGLLVASRDRRILWAALLLAIPVLALRWTAGHYDILATRAVAPLASALFLTFTAGVVFKEIFTERRVTLDEIFGGVLVYILVGVVFGQLHYAVELASPGSYLLGDVALSSIPSDSDWDLILSFRYFSFTTLTTLGYGDIRPLSHVARMLSIGEALMGPLYLAIFVARLVGTYIGQRSEPSS